MQIKASVTCPNPASERLSIGNYQQVNHIEVFNAAGARLLESKRVTAQGLDISHLSPGLHMVKMVLSDGSFQETKLVITRS
ncbi:T9SS type A sorting domain-containing protein [Dyadobacter crusticola]|uniref:T9SS type A sorting domain-containing protein n=1 Tax=Dyadobacter crusticola TaxID=292407 RepID=UPI0009FD063F